MSSVLFNASRQLQYARAAGTSYEWRIYRFRDTACWILQEFNLFLAFSWVIWAHVVLKRYTRSGDTMLLILRILIIQGQLEGYAMTMRSIDGLERYRFRCIYCWPLNIKDTSALLLFQIHQPNDKQSSSTTFIPELSSKTNCKHALQISPSCSRQPQVCFTYHSLSRHRYLTSW